MTFNNSVNSYTLQGAYSILGSTNLLKTGSGLTTISNSNGYTGGTTVSNGTLLLNNAAAAAAGTITLGDANTTANNSSPTLAVSANLSIANAITVANQATAGTYTISGAAAASSTFANTITTNSQNFTIAQASGGTLNSPARLPPAAARRSSTLPDRARSTSPGR